MVPPANSSPHCPECNREFQPGRERCMWCGADLGEVALPELDLKCPYCGEVLEKRPVSSGFIHVCGQCKGTWVSPAILAKIEEFHSSSAPETGNSRADVESRIQRQHGGIQDGVSTDRLYRECPQCGQQMARRRYGHVSNVVADNCMAHGTWFDASEFERVLEFIQAGGMARSREYEAQNPLGGSAIEAVAQARLFARAIHRGYYGF